MYIASGVQICRKVYVHPLFKGNLYARDIEASVVVLQKALARPPDQEGRML